MTTETQSSFIRRVASPPDWAACEQGALKEWVVRKRRRVYSLFGASFGNERRTNERHEHDARTRWSGLVVVRICYKTTIRNNKLAVWRRKWIQVEVLQRGEETLTIGGRKFRGEELVSGEVHKDFLLIASGLCPCKWINSLILLSHWEPEVPDFPWWFRKRFSWILSRKWRRLELIRLPGKWIQSPKLGLRIHR